MTSTRLPGKVLKQVLGKPLLQYQIERLRRVKSADEIVIATTVNAADQPIVEFCQRWGIPCFRGPEQDVLSRYCGAAKAHGAEVVVRVTADCPLIDPEVIERVIRFYLDQQEACDYASNCLERTYPRGMDTEVFSRRTLHEACAEATAPEEREHVTPFIYRHPRRYRIANVAFAERQAHHRWTVDTPEDFELVSRIIGALYPEKPEFTLRDMLGLLAGHPDWVAINAGVQQKALGEPAGRQ